MEKVRLGKTNMMVSKLGFGGIPIQMVSEDEAIAVVRRCLDLGINFLDTSDVYTTSERRIGKAIKGRRDRPVLATKISFFDSDEVKKYLKQSLERLGVESIDLYQFHGISDFKTYESILAPDGAMSVVQEARKAGKVKHIGISSHQIDVAKEAIRSGHFDTLMFPFNFVACEAADELLPLAREHDVGFIAMKPLAGGRIENVTIAFKYLFQFQDVIALPGIGKIREVEEIVKIMGEPRMTRQETEEMQRLRDELSPRFCRHCDYCLPCPEGIQIGRIMDYEPLSRVLSPERLYTGPLNDALEKAAGCDECGECEERCPYNIPIGAMITQYVRQFQEGKEKYQAGLMS